MDAERWQRLSPLLDAMFELDHETRARSMASLREENPQLAEDLESLMALEAERDDFLSQPLVAPLPGMRAGLLVGPYRLERMLGEGGMGQVWLASRADGLYQRRVALKLLRPGLADPKLRLRFTRERQILARLEHPHIARLLDAGISQDNQPYLALEYVDGEPLTDWCRARVLSLDARLRLFLQICAAVSHAHANLIVHRDLKPSNILVTPLDEVRLLDFGIAKLLDTGEFPADQTRTGLRTFTLHYAAPEQIRGEPVTTMTDVYSLGVVLYELLTDARPYRLKRQSDAAWEEAIVGVDPLRPSLAVALAGEDGLDPIDGRRRARALAGDLDNIVLKTLAKRPEQRYPSVEALALDLQRYREGKPVQARAQSVRYRLRKYVHRHHWALATALLVTLVLSTALAIVAWQARQAVQEATRAQALQDFLVGLFELAGRGNADGRLDVRQLLDAGAQRGASELARQPVARAELFGVIARLHLGLGDYRQALDLLDRQAAILAVLGSDAPASLRLEGAAQRGGAQRLLGDAVACVATMRPLQALALREQHQLPVQAAEFASQLGRCERALGQRAAAGVLFAQTIALRRESLVDAPGVAESEADLADLDADRGDPRRALRAYRQALLGLHANAGPRHPLTIDLLQRICATERVLADIDGAVRDCGSALALSVALHGRQHPATVELSRQLAALHLAQGRLGVAQAEFTASRAWLVAHDGASHDAVAQDDASLGRIAHELGDLPAALAAYDAAIAIRRRQHAALPLAELLCDRADVLRDAGRAADARTDLVESRQLRVRLGDGHPLLADVDRRLGEVDAALGQRDLARAELARALHALSSTGAAGQLQLQQARLALAVFNVAHGDTSALQLFDALASLSTADVSLRPVGWLATAQAAALRCRGPDRSVQIAALGRVQRAVAVIQPQGGVLARRIDDLRATCT